MTKQSTGLGVAPRPRPVTWLHHHRQAASGSLHRAMSLPVATLLTWLAVGITLALPASLLVILNNIEAATENLSSPARFSVLLDTNASLDDANRLSQRIAARMDVADVALVDRDQALAGFAADTGLESLLSSLLENPLPHTILVNPRDDLNAEELVGLTRALESFGGVGEVVFDTLWQSRLASAVQLGRRLVFGIGLLMVLGAILILANTIRLAIEARRDEIVVIKLIGGGDAYARRPFLYTGLWSGMGGGLLGAAMTGLFFLYLSTPVDQLMQLYNSDQVFSGLGLMGVLAMMLFGGAIGLFSAWQAASVQLRELEPR